MRYLIPVIAFVIIGQTLRAQAPSAFSYQAVVRNAENNPQVNSNISVQATIIQASPTGTVVFVERQIVVSNNMGLISMNIGLGTNILGSFENIDWSSGPYFLKIDLDPNGGSEFQSIGTTQLLSVPYALYAQNSANDPDSDPINELQDLSSIKDSNIVSLQITQGTGTSFNVDDADADMTNELQQLSITTDPTGGLDGIPLHQIQLSSDQLVTLPISEYWSTEVLKIDPPQISSLSTRFHTEVPSIKIGDPKSANIGIQFNEIRFNREDSLSRGYSIGPELIQFRDHSGGTDYDRIRIGIDDFKAANNVRWNTVTLEWEPYGRFVLSDESGQAMTQITRSSGHNGSLITYGPNGNRNVELGALIGFPNNGYVQVLNHQGLLKAGLFVSSDGKGQLFADVKNFRMNHPADDSKEIVYASLEGPEAAAYLRGSSNLVDGRAVITFPDHFSYVIVESTITISLTPLSLGSKGLSVYHIDQTGFHVGELLDGRGNYEFHWEAKAVREGFEDYKVIRDKAKSRAVPLPKNK